MAHVRSPLAPARRRRPVPAPAAPGPPPRPPARGWGCAAGGRRRGHDRRGAGRPMARRCAVPGNVRRAATSPGRRRAACTPVAQVRRAIPSGWPKSTAAPAAAGRDAGEELRRAASGVLAQHIRARPRLASHVPTSPLSWAEAAVALRGCAFSGRGEARSALRPSRYLVVVGAAKWNRPQTDIYRKEFESVSLGWPNVTRRCSGGCGVWDRAGPSESRGRSDAAGTGTSLLKCRRRCMLLVTVGKRDAGR